MNRRDFLAKTTAAAAAAVPAVHGIVKACERPVRVFCDEEGPDRLLSEIVAEYRAGGLTVPEQVATTYH